MYLEFHGSQWIWHWGGFDILSKAFEDTSHPPNVIRAPIQNIESKDVPSMQGVEVEEDVV